MPLFSIGIVMKLTELTARQIRYYEEQGLIFPDRTKGNQRLFSFNDVDRLLEIKNLLDKGLNLAGIKILLENPKQMERKKTNNSELSEKEFREILRNEIKHRSQMNKAHLRQGEFSRFFTKH